MMKQQKGFTLAETLITLTILGVVAAITVPMLINKQMEAANRTKVKKAMATYEKALNQMIIENDLKDGAAISAFNGTINNGVNATDCENTRPYFKVIESATGNNCRFKTADRVWWDITDIQHPLISLKDEITDDNKDSYIALAKDKDNKEVFGMVGTIDNGVVRINDKGGVAAADEDYVDKLYAFINNEKDNAGSGEGTTLKTLSEQLSECTTWPCTISYSCPVTAENSTGICTANYLSNKSINAAEATSANESVIICEWDYINDVENCSETALTVTAGSLYLSEPITLTENEAKDESICNDSANKQLCQENGDYLLLAQRKCEAQGGRMPTLAELKALYNKHDGTLEEDMYYWAADKDEYDLHYYFNNGNYDANMFNNDPDDKVFCVSN